MGNTFTSTSAAAPPAAGSPLLATSKWSVVTPPTALVVLAEDAAEHLRLGSLAPGPLARLSLMVEAATDYAQDRMSMALMQQTILARFYAGERVILPRGPVIEIVSITDREEIAVTDYELKHYGHVAEVLVKRHGGYPLSVTYAAGHASAAAIPAAIRVAIMTHVGTLYENRESVNDKGKLPVPHSLDDFYRLKSRSAGVG